MRTGTYNVFAQALMLAIAVAGCVVVGCGIDSESTAGTASELGANGPVASQLVADLTAAGLDPQHLPPLDSLEPAKLKKVMKTFTKALNVQCSGCHDTSDYSISTPNKRIAARMWSDFAQGLALKDGGALYCDSCHQGKGAFLDRHDPQGLRQRMSTNFVGKLQRTDGVEQGCTTCHGDPFRGDIFKD